ncbi:lipopolysaccharide biosynthesis protein [Hyphomicrobium sp. DMF-1]|uniref:lipopolysaccharide biosynthesis protein n=1 Tax=Hyphomicrobium sp. DMF-1 TaxID=3019544 RepID=UPI0022EC011D|nr:oligosaccharide flippase family protein [Hyphomicrobium sp. DMF-1]WBT38292.1 oligosaccharide flippase family protein [Hyphomicrobium sp. DMF-1]
MNLGKLWGLLKHNSFVASVGRLVSAHVFGQVILLAAMPLVTRLYAPADFGLLALFTGVFGVVLVASSLRYELAIPLARIDRDAFALLVLALLLNGIFAVATAAAVFFWGGALSRALGAPTLVCILWVLPVSLLGAGSYRAFRLWAVRRHYFDAIAWTKIAQSAANAVSQVGLGLAGLGAVGLAISHCLGLTAGAYKLACTVDPALVRAGRHLRNLRMCALAKRYDRFPKFDVPAAFVDALSVQLPNLLLAVLFNPVVAGHYLLADRVLGAPFSLLSQSIGQVLYARSRKAVEDGSMAALATKVLLGLAAAVAIPTLAVFVLSEPLFAIVFGDAWREAGLFAGWLVMGLFGQFLFSSISLVLMATSAQTVNLALQLAILCARSAALAYGYAAGSALSAITALSFANFLGYLGAAAVVIWHARNHDARSAAQSAVQGKS